MAEPPSSSNFPPTMARGPDDVTQTVHVVDDDGAILSSIESLVTAVGLSFRGYASGQEFLDDYHDTRPACAILDVRMPGMDGLELQKHMRERGITLPILFMTGHGDVSIAVEAMKGGAADFLEKPCRAQDLLERITWALEQDIEALPGQARLDEVARYLEVLTPDERHLLQLMSDGLTTDQLAVETGRDAGQIASMQESMQEKTGARSTSELLRWNLMLREHGDNDRHSN